MEQTNTYQQIWKLLDEAESNPHFLEHLTHLLKGAKRDLLFEQGSGTRRRETTQTLCSRPTQETISGRGTHKEGLADERGSFYMRQCAVQAYYTEQNNKERYWIA